MITVTGVRIYDPARSGRVYLHTRPVDTVACTVCGYVNATHWPYCPAPTTPSTPSR